MPDQRRFRRLGVTSAAVTVGACALLIGGASPADAATTKCAMGHDPATTVKSIECQLKETGTAIQKAIDKLTHKAPPAAKPPVKKPPVKMKPAKKPTKRTQAAPAAPQASAGGGGTAATPLNNPGSVRPYTPQGTTPQLPGLLPEQPQVADQLPAGPITETHLVAPVAQTERQAPASPVWIAGAAGMAGAVGALNLSLARRRRRVRAR
jgi:hypothetical protein